MWNGTMFVDLDLPLNASSLLSASAELLVFQYDNVNRYTRNLGTTVSSQNPSSSSSSSAAAAFLTWPK